MDGLWPWHTLAGLGALHGLSPANGWMFAAARGAQARDTAQARRALWPIAIGHAASVALVVAVVSQGIAMDRNSLQTFAGISLLALALYRGCRAGKPRGFTSNVSASNAGIAMWSGLMATVHGAGLMLVPALIPFCMTGSPAREITASGSVWLALLAVTVHLAAMLVVTGTIAAAVCRGLNIRTRVDSATLRPLWAAALAVTGLWLMAR